MAKKTKAKKRAAVSKKASTRPGRATQNISLTPALRKWVDRQVSSGQYQTASEVVREGLRLMQQREAEHKAAIEEVRGKVRTGLEQARRGEFADGPAFFRDLGKRRERRARGGA